MSDAERLRAFYDFDDEIIGRVGEVAERQNELSYRQLAENFGIGNGPTRALAPNGRPFEYLYFRPLVNDYDESHARIYYSPMGNGANDIMAMRTIRWFAADPTIPTYVVGSPGPFGNNNGTLSRQDTVRVGLGDLSPTVDSFLGNLQARGVTRQDSMGYSLGADRAATSALRGPEFGITAERSLLMEAVTTADRPLWALGRDFVRSGEHMHEAVAACESAPLEEAWKTGFPRNVRYGLGLMRRSNLNIIRALAAGTFKGRVESALGANPAMRATVAWGTDSELTPAERSEAIASGLQKTSPRVGSMVLRGMRHGDGDDIDLHAAIVLQAQREMSRATAPSQPA